MKIGVLKTRGLALLLAGLACFSSVSGQDPKAPAPELLNLLRVQADRGEAPAQWFLGQMYHYGLGVTQDYAEGVRWYRKAAEQGNSAAQFNLGGMYYEGHGVTQDYAEAVRWYRKAAEQGNPNAQWFLGLMYESGQGVPQDYVEAHMWYNLAASRASGDDQKKDADMRERVAAKMTPQQIAEAQRRAREWKPKTAQESKSPTQK